MTDANVRACFIIRFFVMFRAVMQISAYGVIEVFSLVLGNILEILYCIIKGRQQEGGRHEPCTDRG